MTNKTEIKRAIKFLQLIREHVNEDATVKGVITLLAIASEPGLDQTTLIKRTDFARSTVSKAIADLTTLKANKQPGPGLVENGIDPMNLNIRLPRLTKKGEQVMAKISAEAWGVVPGQS